MILAGAKRRPLTHAEVLRLMSLLTTQRIISNGLAQLRFEDTKPRPVADRATRGVCVSSAASLAGR
jgi:hypothetical protein